jgi:hypothetical protein
VETEIKDVNILLGVCRVFFEESQLNVCNFGNGDSCIELKARAYGIYSKLKDFSIVPCFDEKAVTPSKDNNYRQSSVAFEDPRRSMNLIQFSTSIDLAILLCQHFREDSDDRTLLIASLSTMKVGYAKKLRDDLEDIAYEKRMTSFRIENGITPVSNGSGPITRRFDIPENTNVANEETGRAEGVGDEVEKRKKELATRKEFSSEVRKMNEFKLFVDAVKSLTQNERYAGKLEISTYELLTRMAIDLKD